MDRLDRLSPLVLERKLECRLWGGSSLGAYLGLPNAPPNLAEVWAVHEGNRVLGGPHADMTLAEVARKLGAAFLGHRVFARHGARFPLLAKLIDAADKLSVQVHPDDAAARLLETDAAASGKTEAWYVLRAREGASVILGFARPVERARLPASVADGSFLALLRHVPVATGDALLVPAGTVHAINDGILLFEIQQSSNLTYRVYDYGRREEDGKPRALHLDKALHVLDCSDTPPVKTCATASTGRPGPRPLLRCAYFALERWDLDSAAEASTSEETFELLASIEGQVQLAWPGGDLRLCRGDMVLLPASLGTYTLSPAGPASLLRCHLPR